METPMNVDFTYEPANRTAGVYAIRNVVNGRVYVAGDGDVQGAIERDRVDLQRKAHRNAALQSDWNWFGEDSFRFDVVDTIEPAALAGRDSRGGLLRRLDAWRDALRSYGETGYNARVRLAF
jgi:hypothetical protein